MSTSYPNRLLALIAITSVLVLALWLIGHNADTPNLFRVDKSIPLSRPPKIEGYKLNSKLPTRAIKGQNIECYVKQETAKPNIHHRVYIYDDQLLAEEFLIERTSTDSVFEDEFVRQKLPPSLSWKTSKIRVLNVERLNFEEVPLFQAETATHFLKLYQSDGVARLVLVSNATNLISMNDLVQDAKLPSKAVQDALKMTERLLNKD
jgi:hypothetical protein